MAGKFEPVGIAHWKLEIPAIAGSGFFRKCSGLSMRVEHTKRHHVTETGGPDAERIRPGRSGRASDSSAASTPTRSSGTGTSRRSSGNPGARINGTLALLDHKNQDGGLEFNLSRATLRRRLRRGVQPRPQKGELETESPSRSRSTS